MSRLPLVVDLDGTLIQSDTLFEVFISLLFSHPLDALRVLPSLYHGRAAFKQMLSSYLSGEIIKTLPVRGDLYRYLRREKEAGRSLHLVSAADEQVVATISNHFEIFDSFKGSNGTNNLKGSHKAQYLKERFPNGFAYIGDSPADMPVWQAADEILLAGNNSFVNKFIHKLDKPITQHFQEQKKKRHLWLKAFRIHQWSKNALLFAPVLLAGEYANLHALLTVFFGFFGFSLVTSGTYVLNDLSDLKADRAHPTKKNRPFAAGHLPISHGLIAGSLVIVLGLTISLILSSAFALCVLTYLAVTAVYSSYLKRIALVDTLTLAGLFSLRLVMGATLANVVPSQWLLTFSMFFFFSLALAKRHVEVMDGQKRETTQLSKRGYEPDDGTLTLGLGLAAALGSIQILVLYLVFEAMPAGIYSNTVFLWSAPIFISLWLMRIWLLAHRGQLDDDPVVFAVRDKASLLLGVIVSVGLIAALTT